MIKITNTATKVAAATAGFAMALSMLAPAAHAAALTSAQVQAIVSLLQSFGADSTTIANVEASLTGGSVTTPPTTTSTTFTRDLTVGSQGADVTALQNILISNGYLKVAATGYFGALTRSALAAWQSASGITPAAGYFGPKSRAALGGSSSGTTGITGPITGNGLKVSLSPTSPNGTALVQGQGIGDLADFVFANPTGSPITVTGLTFNRTGVSNDSAIANVYLYQGVNRITDAAGVSSGAFSFSNPTGVFIVPAGSAVVISVRADIAAATAGQTIGVALVSVASNGTLDSSVHFPVNGGLQAIASATLATVDFNATTLPSTTTISPQPAYPIWQNTVTVSSNPVKLASMKFTNLGSIDSSLVTNLRLFVDGTQVGGTLPSLAADRTATFDLSANPVLLSQQGHVIKVVADLVGGASRTVQMSIQRSSDAMFIDNQLGQPVTPTKGGLSFGAATAGLITMSSVTGSSGVSVTLDPSSPTANIPVGVSSVKMASFDMLASGENVKVSDLYVEADTSVHNGGLANGKIFVNGVQVGSTKSIAEGTGGTQTGTDFSLGSSLILPAGQTVRVDIYADAKTSTSTNLSNNETAKIWLDAGSSNAQGQSSLNSVNVPAASTGGNTITVVSSALSAAKFSGYGNQTMIAGANNARLGAFTLSTGSTEGVTVNTVVLTMSAANAASITNLSLRDDASGGCTSGTMIGTTITTPSATNSFSTTFDIPASGTKTIDVCGNVLANSNAGPIVITVDTATAGTGDITGSSASPASTATLQTITVGSGALSAAIGAGDPSNAIVTAGASQVLSGEFTFTAQYSPYTIDQLAILVPANAATSVSAITLKYKDVNGVQQTATQSFGALPSGAQTYATATFTGLTMYVPANSTANVDAYVTIPSIASGATSGAQISTVLDNTSNALNGNGFHATDSSGTAKTSLSAQVASTATSGHGTLVVRKSLPTPTAVALGYSTLPLGTNQTVAEFKLTSDPAGDTSWDNVGFTVQKAAVVTIGTTAQVSLWSSTNGSSWSQVTGTFSTTTTTGGGDTFGAATTGTLIFQPSAEQLVAAGQSVYYQLRGTVGDGGSSGSSNLSISMGQPSASVKTDTAANVGQGGSATDSLTWSDRSSINTVHSLTTTDWTNDYLVPNLPLAISTLVTNH